MNNNTLAEGILSIMNSTPKNSAEHDERAHSQQRTSQLQYSPLYNNCSSEQAANSAVLVTTSAKAIWRVDCKTSNDGKKSYVATVLLDKSDPSAQTVFNAINVAKNKGLRDFWNNWNCDNYPIHDGDKETPENANSENYKGRYYLYARSNAQPIIVSATAELLQDNKDVYVDCSTFLYEGPVAMRFFPYSNHKSGVSCSLAVLMAVKAAGC